MKRIVLLLALLPTLTFAQAICGYSSGSNPSPIYCPATAPAAIPPAYVLTPVGFLHASCVYEIPNGGTPVRHPPCSYPALDRNGYPRALTMPVVSQGWLAATRGAHPPNALPGRLTVQWSVPTIPAVVNYPFMIFPGLQASRRSAAYPNIEPVIIQPVVIFYLGRYWMAPWICDSGSSPTSVCDHTPLVPVDPADTINAAMVGAKSCNAVTCEAWIITMTDISHNPHYSTSMLASVYGQTLDLIFGFVLEAYVPLCTALPREGLVAADYISLWSLPDFNSMDNDIVWAGSTDLDPKRCNAQAFGFPMRWTTGAAASIHFAPVLYP